jgi:hypothetical protein
LYQDLLRHRIAALRFQLGEIPWSPRTHTYRTRWQGRLGWGPRFEGWAQIIDTVSRIEFNALQWTHCVNTALDDLNLIAPERILAIRYEDFITRPEAILRQIMSFAGLTLPPGFMDRLPAIQAGNQGKWRKALSPDDQEKVARIITPTLERLKYDV